MSQTKSALILSVLLISTSLFAQKSPQKVDLSSDQIGRLTSAGNGGQRTFYQYDLLGRIVANQIVQENASRVVSSLFGYPQSAVAAGGPGTHVIAQTLPDGESLDYGYDAGSMEVSIRSTPPSQPAEDIVRNIRRNARGQTTSATYGNGAVTTHIFDPIDFRLHEITTVAGASTIQDYVYHYDENSNVTAIDDMARQILSTTYRYDELDQLTSVSDAGGSTLEGYAYDPVGNLTTKGAVTQVYGAGGRPHAIASAGAFTYDYDLNGNVTAINPGETLEWNAENMSSRITIGATVTSKSFIGESLWKKVENGVTTYYIPSLRFENGVPRKYYGAFAERSAEDGRLRFYHGDHLGSSVVMTDAGSALALRTAYLPYGETRGVECATPPCFTPKLQFNFKEKDATGFYDFGARIYNPGTGRWLSPDTETADGMNHYAYTRNNPVRYVDPDGHQIQPNSPPPPWRGTYSPYQRQPWEPKAPWGPGNRFEGPEPNLEPHNERTDNGLFSPWVELRQLMVETNHLIRAREWQEKGFIARKHNGKPVLNFERFKFRPYGTKGAPLPPCHFNDPACYKARSGPALTNGAQCNAYGCWNRPVPERLLLPADPDPRYYENPADYNTRRKWAEFRNGKWTYNF